MPNKQQHVSLYVKITLTFLAILVLLGVLQLLLSARGWLLFVQESQQRLFHPIATNIARQLEPHTAGTLDLSAVENVLEQHLSPPLLFEIYLLNSKGRIVYHNAEATRPVAKQVPIEPIKKFLGQSGLASGVVLGQNPRRDEEAIFSAAPLRIAQDNGYLYIVLNGIHYRSVLAVLGRSYFLQVSLMGVGLSLSAAAVVGMLSFMWLTSPLQRITAVVAEYARGNYGARTQVETRDELRDLSDTMNTMAAVIEEQVHALERKDQLRRELIANISHDLRTPLTSLGGTIEAELERFDTRSRDELKEGLERAYKNFRFTKTLVAELFELSSLEAGVRVPEIAPIPIDELIEDSVVGFAAVAESKQQQLVWELPEALPAAMGDFAMISKVIVNLVQNALRYTPNGGTITVVADSSDSEVVVEVSDNGPGIPADELPSIFQRFYRASDSQRSSEPGSGLGLAIVKEIMDLHHAPISVESEYGSGTTFQFRLRRADAN